ncbi:gamma-glutamyltransferase family protein [Amorphus coralli]|uniref:gamma-glutamyltransferase family protein n=1 Tax=Amorphus coralli TaxID=340680 RepID=UPI00036D7252|nr:gamma-glutamyltransferase family protein [Amorphus coralli]
MRFDPTPLYPSRRSPVFAENAVATSQPLAAQAGLAMLAKGGNAVDAALAAAITLPVVEPTGNGLGSDAFAILWDGEQLHGLNASGPSPAGWTPDRFAGQTKIPFRGWEAVTVPGAVSAWAELSREFGRLDFADLFEPAIRYARDGFVVTPIIGKLWELGARELAPQPGFADMFMPGGRAPAPGEVFRSEALARSLEMIAASGGETFYRGELAEKIAAHSAACGGAMTADDLADYRPEWVGTIDMDAFGVSMHEIPPNGQGIAALMALGILDSLDLGPEMDSPQSLHCQIEAMKLALADLHAYVADPRHMDRVSSSDLLDRNYLADRAKLIDPKKAQAFQPGPFQDGGTVYITAADADGMMVSFIQSNYSGFGSGVVVPDTGISLQNRGAGFSLAEGHPNQVGPGKKPFHTIIPGFLMRDGAPLTSFGVMGGPIQAQGHVQMALRMEVFGQDPQTACDAPRWRVLDAKRVAIEPEIGKAALDGLEALGHEITFDAPGEAFGFGGAQAIRKLDRGYVAGSDPRKDGCAVGF